MSTSLTSTPVSVPGAPVPTEPKPGLPFVSYLFLVGFFVLLIVGLIIWIILSNDTLNTRNLNETQSPFCLEFQCINNTQKTNYQLDPSADPNSATYQTFNYCSVNAPPTSFVQSLEVCGGIISSDTANAGGTKISPPTQQEVEDFAKFYNQEYVDTCGWSWKNPPPKTQSQSFPQGDPVINALSACATQLGITNNSDIQELQTKCGSDCSSFIQFPIPLSS